MPKQNKIPPYNHKSGQSLNNHWVDKDILDNDRRELRRISLSLYCLTLSDSEKTVFFQH